MGITLASISVVRILDLLLPEADRGLLMVKMVVDYQKRETEQCDERGAKAKTAGNLYNNG